MRTSMHSVADHNSPTMGMPLTVFECSSPGEEQADIKLPSLIRDKLRKHTCPYNSINDCMNTLNQGDVPRSLTKIV